MKVNKFDVVEFVIETLREYASEKGEIVRGTTDLSPLENWLLLALYESKCIPVEQPANGAVEETTNPHWVGDEPAWDINISENITLKDITQKDILLLTRNHVDEYCKYDTIVRRYHIIALKKVKLNVKLIK